MSSTTAWINARARWIFVAIALLVFALARSSTRPRSQRVGARVQVELMSGQEAALEPLLGRGAALPDGCAFTDLDAQSDRVVARYACPNRSAPLALDLYVDRPMRPIPGYSGRFGVETSAGFPQPLRDAVLARISASENRLNWQVRGAPPPRHEDRATSRTPPPRHEDRATSRTPPPRWNPFASLSLREVLTHEPSLPLLGALILLLAFTRRLLRGEPSRVAWTLVAITLAGAALRLGLAVDAPMNAHSFSRLIPMAVELYRGPLLSWVSARGHDMAFTDVQSWSNLALAVVMPVAFFAHARLLLGDARTALVAAAIMAFLPMHIRFSRSDVTFIASLLASSSTFVALYGSLTDPSRLWRLGCAAMIPVLSLATYSARPENMVFVFLDLGALGLYLRAGLPRRRLALAAVLIASTAAWSAATDLLVRYRQNVGEGLNVETLRHAAEILVDRHYNTLINPWMTPAPLPLLAVVGAVTLWREGRRNRAVFLVVWLSAFFVVHSFIRPTSVAMQARYHLHLVSPFALLAAAATPRVASLPRAAAVALVAWLALSPFFHRNFIRDTDYTEMHEYAFLRRVRGRIAPSCAVLEFGPAVELPRPAHYLALRSERMAMRLRGGVVYEPRTLQIGVIPSDNRSTEAAEVFALTDAFVARPPRCLYYYESAACTTHSPAPGALARPCEEVRRRFALTPVAEEHHRLRPYDDVILRRVLTAPDGRVTVRAATTGDATVHLGLYRLNPLH